MIRSSPARLELTDDQVRFFRARRGHLAGPGAETATEAARAVIGVQAQQIEPALLALAQRTAGRPSAAFLAGQLFRAEPRSLVRTWGQRDTVHIYDAHLHWASTVTARRQWTQSRRGGPMPDDAMLDDALRFIPDVPVTRKDLYEATPSDYVEAVAGQAEMARQTALHFAAGRLLWQLCRRGDLSLGEKRGAEQEYVPRRVWFPELEWPQVHEPTAAGAALTRDYLAVYGPATKADVAHFFGARIGDAKRWLEVLEEADELLEVACGERRGLLALAADREALSVEPPPAADAAWPVRLLPKFDTLLMGHKDKSWTVPGEKDRPQIWRKAANVMAAVLARGQLVATWTLKKRARDVVITVEPLGGWRRTHLKAVEREAQTVARHLERERAAVEVLD